MRSIDEEIAHHLQEALASGELGQAKGYGKPMQEDAGWNDTPPALRLPFKILKDAGIVPPEVQLMHERSALAAAIRDCQDEATRAVLRARYSEVDQAISLRLETLRASGSL